MAGTKQLLIDIGGDLYLMPGMPTIASWDDKTRPQNPKAGTFGFNTQTNNLEYFDGSDWYGGSMAAA